MTHASFCSGIGGIDLAAEWAGFESRFVCEIDEQCRRVLAARFPGAVMATDLFGVRGADIIDACGGRPTLLSAGIPCQPFSVAGKRSGASDERHLWPEVARIVRETRPQWVLVENVRGLLSISNGRVFGAILSDLAHMGYRVGWACYGADEAASATHRRDRVFVVGYLADQYEPGLQGRDIEPHGRCQCSPGQSCGELVHGDGVGRQFEFGIEPGMGTRRDLDGSGEKVLAHGADDHGRRGERGEEAGTRQGGLGWRRPTSRSGELGDPEGRQDHLGKPGGLGATQPGRERGDAAPGNAGGELEHGSEPGSGGGVEHSRSALDRPCQDAGGKGIVQEPAKLERRGPAEPERRRPFLFPPGPNDYDAWARVLSARPDLAPALSVEEEAELEVRRMADGVPGGLALTRRQRLKMLGNAVVPAQVYPILAAIAEVCR